MQTALLVVGGSDTARQIARTVDPTCWKVESVELGAGALVAAVQRDPVTVVLDAREHCGSCAEFCRTFRSIQDSPAAPVIALTKEGRSEDRLLMLEAGADDCWIEPIDNRELRLRLDAVHRRLHAARARRLLRYGGIELDLDRYTVRAKGAPVQLTAMQLKVLRHFIENPGVTFSRKQLLDQVWHNAELDEGAVTACILRIRRALAAAGAANAIRNVRTTGAYVFETEAESPRKASRAG